MEEKDRKNRIRFEFEARSQNESLARSVAAAYVLPLDPTVEEVTEIKTAVSEAVSNAIIHAYPGKEETGIVILEAELRGERDVMFVIRDKGVGIADVSQARAPLFTTGAPEERSGMGFTVMESFMDKIEVRSEPGNGTEVTLIKRLDSGNDW
ncbi:MAG: anti-sigma F factor [Firmicutes bacterium]|nr:anti-sigma F factor [Bacillota bacterium]